MSVVSGRLPVPQMCLTPGRMTKDTSAAKVAPELASSMHRVCTAEVVLQS